MLFAVAVLLTSSGYVILSPPQTAEPPLPLTQLMQDLSAAETRAHLNDAQRTRLQSDGSVLQAAREARDQGRPVNRGAVTAAVRDIRGTIDSGAFTADDKQKLLADIQVLRSQH